MFTKRRRNRDLKLPSHWPLQPPASRRSSYQAMLDLYEAVEPTAVLLWFAMFAAFLLGFLWPVQPAPAPPIPAKAATPTAAPSILSRKSGGDR